MKVMERRVRAALHGGDGTRLVPPWLAVVFLLCAGVLIPWTVLLFLTLPDHYGANHWALAWGGFDIALGVAMIATAVAIVRSSRFAEVAATVTGTLLVCDAWFDVVTSRGTADLAQAVASALLVELPLAYLCFWIARNLARAMECVRPYLRSAGFRVEAGRLVAPPAPSGGDADAVTSG